MSKLKPSETDKYNGIIYANIKARCSYFGYATDKDAGEKIGMSKETFYNRRDNGHWDSNELVHAAMALKVPVTWFFEDHSKVEEVKILNKEEFSRLSELLKDVSGLIRDINELENKTKPAGEKEAKN